LLGFGIWFSSFGKRGFAGYRGVPQQKSANKLHRILYQQKHRNDFVSIVVFDAFGNWRPVDWKLMTAKSSMPMSLSGNRWFARLTDSNNLGVKP
jgi:hypothetical protein